MTAPCPSTKSSSPPRSCPSTTSRSAAPAMKSETTASTAIPQPAIAIPVWPVGTKRDASPRARRGPVELERDGHLPDRAVGADREHVPRRLLEVRAGGDVQVRGRPAQVAQLDAVPRGERAQLLVVAQELVQAVLDVQAARDGRPQQLAPRGREAAALGGDADERRRRLEAERLLDRADDRDAALRLPRPRRVEDRDDRPLAVGEHAARGLPVVRVAREALGEDQQPLRRGRTPSPGRLGRHLDAVGERDARPRVVGDQQVPVEVDVVAERRDGAAGGDPEPRLDHAAEHDAEPERARGVRHPDRLADPARLRELDVDPVRDLGAGGDAVEPVAVLVDVDRDRRALLQRPPALVAGAERLLAVLDAELLQLRQRVERLVERPPLVHVDLERQLGDARGRRGRARRRARRRRRASASAAGSAAPPSRRAAPCRPDRRARPSTRSAGPCAAGRAASRPGRRAASPAGRAARRRAPPSPRSRPAAAAPRSPRARTGRRRARPPPPRDTRARTRPTRRSARSAPPRRSR